jgi:hypothetical protein
VTDSSSETTTPPIVEIAANIRAAAAPKPTPVAAPAPLAVPTISRAEELAQRARALAMRALNTPQIEAKPSIDVTSPATAFSVASTFAAPAMPPLTSTTATASVDAASTMIAGDALSAATLSTSSAALLAEAYGELAAAKPAREHPVLVLEPTPTAGPHPITPIPAVMPALGVRVTRQGVLFLQAAGLGQHLAIAGEFNGWNPASAKMRLNRDAGVFECLVKLPPGRHAYRLVVDGRWINDPHNPVTELNPFNEPNSIVTVAA